VAALSPVSPPKNLLQLLVSAIFFLAASGCFAFVGWLLQRFEYMARAEYTLSKRVAETKAKLVAAALYRRVVPAVAGGLCLTAIGFLALILR